MVDAAREQFVKLDAAVAVTESYELQFFNGAVSTTSDLGEILAQENHGSARIVRLVVKINALNTSPPAAIELHFRDLGELDEEKRAVSLLVQAGSRDWVFVTTSLLEERLNKIRRISFSKLITGRAFTVALIGSLYAFLAFGATSEVSRYSYPVPEPIWQQQDSLSRQLREAQKKSLLKDGTEAVILVQELQERADQRMRQARDDWEKKADAWAKKNKRIPIWARALLFFVTPLAILGAYWVFLQRYYPLYNFCWGDYLDVFNKKESARRFLIIVVLVGVVVSFIGGILANLLSKH
jgi:lysylphosphatidylglycerol synthetase-like protein (DUF2156 family)